MKTFGERLKLLRGTQSQALFAAALGIPQMTLSNYERDRNEPKFAVIDKICTLFEVNPAWLLFGRGLMRPGEEGTDPEGCETAEATPAACLRCAKLESALEQEQEERRRVNEALIEALTKNLSLTEENGRLRLENLKAVQRLETMGKIRSEEGREKEVAPDLFEQRRSIRSNESLVLRCGERTVSGGGVRDPR